MTAFVAAAIAMLIGIIPAGVVLCRSNLMAAVVAYEFITSVMVMVLALLAQGFQRSGLFELAVLLAVLMFGSGLVFVRTLPPCLSSPSARLPCPSFSCWPWPR
ncbi:MAG: monovalent cation/H+ antiporter complex subunit F [Streptosporangiaceae bacterium]